jgi:hypothetical protein
MAVQFFTNGDSLTTNVGLSQSIMSNDTQTISVWLNALWDGKTKVSSLVGMYNSTNSSTSGTAIQLGSRVARGQCDIWDWGGKVLVSTTGVSIPSNQWVNITYTFDGSTHSIYYNGVLNNTSKITHTSILIDTVYINGYANSLDPTLETANFYVDSYEYYTRVLAAEEILSIYASGGNQVITYGCMLRYDFCVGVLSSNAIVINNLLTNDNLYSATGNSPSMIITPSTVTYKTPMPLS